MTHASSFWFRRLFVVATVMAAALGVNLLPATAHMLSGPSTDYYQGHGSFVAVSNPQPPTLSNFCADYREYTADLVFDHAPVAGATATITSAHNPANVWGEFADGTYANKNGALANVTCDGRDLANGQGKGGHRIHGFAGTLTTADGTVCELGDVGNPSSGTYQRGHLGQHNPELNVMFSFSEVTKTGGSGVCPGATTTAPFVVKTTIVHTHPDPLAPSDPESYVTACNSPIAPQTCGLDHQERPTEW